MRGACRRATRRARSPRRRSARAELRCRRRAPVCRAGVRSRRRCRRACRCVTTDRPRLRVIRTRRWPRVALRSRVPSIGGVPFSASCRRGPYDAHSRTAQGHGATLERVTAVEWLDAMSPWPRDGFGLERMRALLAELGNPEAAYPAIHVVGTNGKSTATVTIEQLLLSEGLTVGSTISPHVASWSERIRLNGVDADFEEAVARVRAAGGAPGGDPVRDRHRGCSRGVRARRASTSQSSRQGSADGTTRRTCCAPASCSSRTSGSSTRTSSATRSRRSRPRSSRSHPRTAIVVLPDDTYAHLVPGREIRYGGAREAAEAFVGHAIAATPDVVPAGSLRAPRRRDPRRRAQSRRCASPRRTARP